MNPVGIQKPDPETARLICEVYDTEGQPFVGDPRYILKRGLAQAHDMGYDYNTGPEVEFFLFKMDGEPRVSPVPQDVGSYFDFSPRDLASRVRNHIAQALQEMGIEVEATHHEVAPGQHEVDFHYADALVSADAVVTVAHGLGQARPVLLVSLRFQEDEVVARAVHLDELHLCDSRRAKSRVIWS